MRLCHSKNTLLEQVNRMSGTDVLLCYQCGKCTASCPAATVMEFGPRRMMQYIKLGAQEKALKSNTSWFCLACATCSARCPREIDIPRVMEAVRHIALQKHIECPDPDARNVKHFHEMFMNMVHMFGRMYELGLMAEFNIRTLQFFKDIFLAPEVLGRGKLALLPHPVKNTDAIRRMAAACEKLEAETAHSHASHSAHEKDHA